MTTSSPRLELRAKQHLALTPRLQQSVRLLQLSTIEFSQELHSALAQNPFLEEEDSWTAASDAAAAASAEDTPSVDTLATTAPEPPSHEQGLDDSLWGSSSNSSSESSAVWNGAERQDGDDSDVSDWAASATTLRQHLHEQLASPHITDDLRPPARLIIEALDDDGYLRLSLDELLQAVGNHAELDGDTLASALKLVQSFDPPGIAARSIDECILLQLRALPSTTPYRELAIAIAREHVQKLARREFEEIEAMLDCSEDHLRQAAILIRSCDPRPGSRFGPVKSLAVVPDVIVRKIKGKWVAAVNPAVRPRIRINRVYARMLRGAKDRSHATLSQHLQEAYWLMRNVEQRFSTIQRVADAIVARQRAFFEVGDVALKPLLMRDLAEELSLHESTISRATGNKYMATPRGTFEFRHFFSREFETRTGGKCSAAAVRALLRQMIAEEDSAAPLTDVSLAKMLGDQGVRVARRTIAKYRALMNVPPADLRRQI